MQRHRLPIAVTAVLAGLLTNVAAQDGGKTVLILLAAGGGCVVVLAGVVALSGGQVVRHAQGERAAIESGTHPMKELTK